MNGFGAIGELAWGETSSDAITPVDPGVGAAAVWAYELLPGITAGDMLIALYEAHLAGTLKVDAQFMNSAEVIGTGATGDPWRGVGVSP